MGLITEIPRHNQRLWREADKASEVMGYAIHPYGPNDNGIAVTNKFGPGTWKRLPSVAEGISYMRRHRLSGERNPRRKRSKGAKKAGRRYLVRKNSKRRTSGRRRKYGKRRR